MKTSFLKIIIPVCIVLAAVGLIFIVLKQPSGASRGSKQNQSSAQHTSSWENPMDKREYWGDHKIAEYTQLLRDSLYKKDEEPNLVYMSLVQLGKLGTTKSVQVLQEYLEINKPELPEVAPSKAEMGDAKSRMNCAKPITPEGKVIGAIENLIASGTPEGERIAMNVVAEIKAKYHDSEYGDIFSKYLDHAVAQGRALASYHAELRSLPNFMR